MVPGCLPPITLSSIAQAVGNVLRSGTLTVGTFSNSGTVWYGLHELLGTGNISPLPFLVNTKRAFIILYLSNEGRSWMVFETGGVEPTWNSMVINGKTTMRSAATSKGVNGELFTPGGTTAYQYYFPGDILNGARSGNVPIAFY